MSSSSDGHEGSTHEKEILIVDQEMEARSGKRKFDHLDILENLESLTEEQIKEIVGIVKKHNANQSPQKTPEPEDQTDKFTLVSYKSKKSNQQSHNYTGQQKSGPSNNKHRNVSVRMKEILNKSYNNLFYINTLPQINTRTKMADIWESERPGNADIILKTKKGFLLKTDTPKIIINNTLKSLKSSGKITDYSSTNPYNQNTRSENIPIQSYSCVISSVETDISDIQIAEYLKSLNFNFRYCKRIISKKSNLPTHFIRIITGDIESNEKLLNEGLFYKSRHYAVFPSAPPPPAPLPCGKCLEYTHKVEDCTAPVKCQKCNDKHPTAKCPTHLPPKCTSCGSEQHQAWSFQCPNRPTKPIEGIPNLPIKTLNKKSRELSCETKKKKIEFTLQ